MTKYYVDKTKSSNPVYVLLSANGCLRGVYESVLDAQDDKDTLTSGGPWAVISCCIIKDRGKHKNDILL